MNGFLIMLLGILVGCAFIGLLVAYVFLVSYSVMLVIAVLRRARLGMARDPVLNGAEPEEQTACYKTGRGGRMFVRRRIRPEDRASGDDVFLQVL